jgi:hypothetical protein
LRHTHPVADEDVALCRESLLDCILVVSEYIVGGRSIEEEVYALSLFLGEPNLHIYLIPTVTVLRKERQIEKLKF